MSLAAAAFWIGAGLAVYAYVGYALCVAALARFRPRPARPADGEPLVSLVIPAHNEAAWMATKLDNTLLLDYPPDKLDILVVSDGSDDGTERLAEAYATLGVRTIVQPVRAGKEAAMHVAAKHARGGILVFTDANAMLNREALRRIVRWFADPEVGCVAGEKRVGALAGESPAAGEGAYWRYESWLKRLDSVAGSAMGATGELLAIRRELVVPKETDNIIEDFVLSMRAVIAGYRIVYEPDAVATEEAPAATTDVFERRARIAAGAFQAMWRLRPMLDPRRGVVWWQYVSHRVLRWAVVPFCLPVLLVLNAILLPAGPLYQAAFVIQAAFYGAALTGWALRRRAAGRLRVVLLPFFFSAANLAAIVGCARLATHRQTVLWKKARR